MHQKAEFLNLLQGKGFFFFFQFLSNSELSTSVFLYIMPTSVSLGALRCGVSWTISFWDFLLNCWHLSANFEDGVFLLVYVSFCVWICKLTEQSLSTITDLPTVCLVKHLVTPYIMLCKASGIIVTAPVSNMCFSVLQQPCWVSVSSCINTKPFHFKVKSLPGLCRDVHRTFRFTSVAQRITSNQLKWWRCKPSTRIWCKTVTRPIMVLGLRRYNLFSGIRRCQWGRACLKADGPQDFGFLWWILSKLIYLV